MKSASRWLPVLLIIAGLCSPAHAALDKQLVASLSAGGLQPVEVKGLDQAFSKPDVSLAAYTKVKLDPVEVSFAKGWDPEKTGTRFKLTPQEREDIAAGVARNVSEAFAKTLQARSTYQLTDTAGPDVLRVKARIIDLIVNAPDVMAPGRTRTYTMSTGSMTLVAELYDSQSNEVLARVADHRESRFNEMWRLTNSVVNDAEVRDVAARWGRILRDALDKAHGIGRK
jgi:hypothetical protein